METTSSAPRTVKSGQAVRIARMQKATVHQALKDVGTRCSRATRALPHPDMEAYSFLADACGSAANALTAAIDAASLRPEKDGPLNDGTLERMLEVAYLQGACAFEALRVVDRVMVALSLYSDASPEKSAMRVNAERLISVASSAAPAFAEPNRLRAIQATLVETQAWLQNWVIKS